MAEAALLAVDQVFDEHQHARVTFQRPFSSFNPQSACAIAIREFVQLQNEPEKSSTAVLSPRLDTLHRPFGTQAEGLKLATGKGGN